MRSNPTLVLHMKFNITILPKNRLSYPILNNNNLFLALTSPNSFRVDTDYHELSQLIPIHVILSCPLETVLIHCILLQTITIMAYLEDLFSVYQKYLSQSVGYHYKLSKFVAIRINPSRNRSNSSPSSTIRHKLLKKIDPPNFYPTNTKNVKHCTKKHQMGNLPTFILW